MPIFLHLREIMLHNLEATGAIIAVMGLVVYVKFAAHALRARRHSR